ncbi:hypothetical protein A1Q2_07173 [Trichosporon asahii var. asahii CBS 8904]|uniref:Uncharacterized protein n=1 Tax=Trichosporon asahii var. asahii (strain CBS 8904) TaxID=1220162 RepID=K1VPF2_TRIAC|nr:hypothetical protein A1Q2_07173 [Trichosporon asahii var. asahii CBS 8904]
MNAKLARFIHRFIIACQLSLIYLLVFCFCAVTAHFIVVVQIVLIGAVTGTLPKPTPRVQNWAPQPVNPYRHPQPPPPLPTVQARWFV